MRVRKRHVLSNCELFPGFLRKLVLGGDAFPDIVKIINDDKQRDVAFMHMKVSACTRLFLLMKQVRLSIIRVRVPTRLVNSK